MSDLDLFNDFWRATEKEKHLGCYTRLIKRARPYTLDDDAVELITEIASGPTIAEKLAIYRILARLPFDTIWIELNYEARYNTRVRLGTSFGEKPKDTPDRMGWLMERITDTSWRATTIIRYEADATKSGRTVDTFGAVHVLSTEGKLNFTSMMRDPVLRQAVYAMNEYTGFYDEEKRDGAAMAQAIMWGFGADDSPNDDLASLSESIRRKRKKNITLPRHLSGTNAVDLAASWEPIMNRVSKGSDALKFKETQKHIMNCAVELQGDLRFLCAALATINEVPVVVNEMRQPGSMRVGGAMKPYMINRVVTIAIPKKRGRVRKVMGMLRLAEKRMRAHEVGGHWKTVYSGPGRTVAERRWISDYQRGDASLGFVHQEREVVKQT